MTDIIGFAFGFQEVAMLVGAGLFLPAIAVALMKILELPGLIKVVDGFMWAGGKWFSTMLIKVFPKRGQEIEDFMEKWITGRLKKFQKAMNSDDK